MRTIIGRLQSRRRHRHLQVASFVVGVALLIAGARRRGLRRPSIALTRASATTPPGSTAGETALKPIDQAALQATVAMTAKKLMIPGAVVLLRTVRR